VGAFEISAEWPPAGVLFIILHAFINATGTTDNFALRADRN